MAKMGGMQIDTGDFHALEGGPPMPLGDVITANHRTMNMYMLAPPLLERPLYVKHQSLCEAPYETETTHMYRPLARWRYMSRK